MKPLSAHRGDPALQSPDVKVRPDVVLNSEPGEWLGSLAWLYLNHSKEQMMIEARPSLLLQPSAVIGTLTRQAALKAVKHKLRARGLKLRQVACRDLSIMARDYLAQHRQELTEEAAEMLRGSPELQRLYAREQRDRQRQLEREQAAQGVQRTTINPTVPGQSSRESQ